MICSRDRPRAYCGRIWGVQFEEQVVKRSVVLPVYNEGETIALTIRAVEREIAEWPDVEIIICDNASTDNTVEVVDGLAAKDRRIRLLPADKNRLYAWNVDRGIKAATGDRIFVLDGDGQFPPSVFHDLDAELAAGAGLVLGHRTARVGGPVRIVASYTYLILCRLYIGFDLRDINAGARGLSRDFANVVDVKYLQMMVNPELFAAARSKGFPIREVSVGHEHRVAGTTSHVFSKPWELVAQAVRYFSFLRRTYRPLGPPRLTRRIQS